MREKWPYLRKLKIIETINSTHSNSDITEQSKINANGLHSLWNWIFFFFKYIGLCVYTLKTTRWAWLCVANRADETSCTTLGLVHTSINMCPVWSDHKWTAFRTGGNKNKDKLTSNHSDDILRWFGLPIARIYSIVYVTMSWPILNGHVLHTAIITQPYVQ